MDGPSDKILKTLSGTTTKFDRVELHSEAVIELVHNRFVDNGASITRPDCISAIWALLFVQRLSYQMPRLALPLPALLKTGYCLAALLLRTEFFRGLPSRLE